MGLAAARSDLELYYQLHPETEGFRDRLREHLEFRLQFAQARATQSNLMQDRVVNPMRNRLNSIKEGSLQLVEGLIRVSSKRLAKPLLGGTLYSCI